MAITLSEDVERRIRDLINTGRYDSAESVIVAGLDELQSPSAASRRRRAAVRELIQEGLRDLDAGESTEYDDESLRARLEQVIADGHKRHGLPASGS